MHTSSGLTAVIALSLSAALASFAVASDTIDGRPADQRPRAAAAAPPPVTPMLPATRGGRDPGGVKDQVIADDLIVQSSLCVGVDCVDNEGFGFDTIKLKANNLRIHFDDTSVGAFPANDWQLVANDTASGGVSRFSIEDVTAAHTPFSVIAGAPTDSLFISATGRIGLRSNLPQLDLHIDSGDTPAVRMQQNNGDGFTAQTWDIGANEANFFVRDVTGGSLLPLRIRPGAPTSSIDIAPDGDVGIGASAPTARFHVAANFALDAAAPALRVVNSSYPEEQRTRFEVDSDGNVAARGTLSQLSSRSAKWSFNPIDGEQLLSRLRALPVTTWSYLSSEVRHAGPVAEDFHAAFGLGASDRMIAPADLAGVALAAVKALQHEVDERDRRIEALEQRLLEIEARLPR